VCGPQECCCEKRCEIQTGSQEIKSYDGWLKTKILIIKIQVNLVPNSSETWRNSPELLLLNFLPLTNHHSHFLVATLDFTSFLTTAFLGATHFFTAVLRLLLHNAVLNWRVTVL